MKRNASAVWQGDLKQGKGSVSTASGVLSNTQYSFSTDPKLRGAPSGHIVTIREVRLNAGAEFVVMICGDIMTMPGLPKVPSSVNIDVDESGKIVGLF